MSVFADVSLKDDGWNQLLRGMAKVSNGHPLDHNCVHCRSARKRWKKDDR